MDAFFNPQTLLLCVFALMALGAALFFVRYAAGRFRTVPEGHVALVQWLDRHSRTVDHPYWLWPFENEVAQVYVRQREAAIAIPNIFTDGGIPVTLNLWYAYRIDPLQMNRDELYYAEADRTKQQQTLIRHALLDLIQDLAAGQPNPAAASQPGVSGREVDVGAIFSPFAGLKAVRLRSELKGRIGRALSPHGIILTESPVVIAGLSLPDVISDAYTESLGAKFDASARTEIMERIRSAIPGMSEAGLVQVLNVIQNPSADIHTIFSTGTMNQEMLVGQSGPSFRQRIDEIPPQSPTAPSPISPPQQSPIPPPAVPLPSASQRQPSTGVTGDDIGADPDYPLVESDNALIKSTHGETHAEGRR